jgi:hypothetical protein
VTVTAAQVYGKARAFVEALRRLPRRQHAVVPRGHFARDYNTLRKLALEALPDLDERLLGKYVSVRPGPQGEELAEASFVEIETYAREILEQLAPLVPLAVRQGKPLPAQAGTSWTAAEDEQLVREFDAGKAVPELAQVHQRTEGAIRSRLLRLGRLTLVPASPAPDPALQPTGGPLPGLPQDTVPPAAPGG